MTSVKGKPPHEFYLCSGVCAKILFLCKNQTKILQHDFVTKLYDCFNSPGINEWDTSKFINCKIEISSSVRSLNFNDNAVIENIKNKFEANIKPLLDHNKIDSIIQAFCKIIDKDINIRSETVFNKIEDITKSSLPSTKKFYFIEFVVDILIYTIKSTVNVKGRQCLKTITKDYLEQFSAKKPPFKWEWTRQKSDSDTTKTYQKKSIVLDELLTLLEQNSNVDFLCVFGGVSSKLIEDETCGLFSKWLSKNKEANLYLCYEVGEAAEARAMILDQNKIKPDGLPIEPSERMKTKEEKIREAINKFPNNIRNRVNIIPITIPLTHHIILVDNEVYWNNLSDKRSSDSTAYTVENTSTGIKSKREHIEYVIGILEKIEDVDLAILIRSLRKKIAALNSTEIIYKKIITPIINHEELMNKIEKAQERVRFLGVLPFDVTWDRFKKNWYKRIDNGTLSIEIIRESASLIDGQSIIASNKKINGEDKNYELADLINIWDSPLVILRKYLEDRECKNIEPVEDVKLRVKNYKQCFLLKTCYLPIPIPTVNIDNDYYITLALTRFSALDKFERIDETNIWYSEYLGYFNAYFDNLMGAKCFSV